MFTLFLLSVNTPMKMSFVNTLRIKVKMASTSNCIRKSSKYATCLVLISERSEPSSQDPAFAPKASKVSRSAKQLAAGIFILESSDDQAGIPGTIQKGVYLGNHVEYTIDSPVGELFMIDHQVDQLQPSGSKVTISFLRRGVSLVRAD